mgnify:CR=1 FL=1
MNRPSFLILAQTAIPPTSRCGTCSSSSSVRSSASFVWLARNPGEKVCERAAPEEPWLRAVASSTTCGTRLLGDRVGASGLPLSE